MRILGLDLSLCNTGCIILDRGSVVDATTIKPDIRGMERLYLIKNAIKTILKKHKPKLVVIEGYAYSPHRGRAFSIGELGGIIKLMLFVNHIDYLIVAPTTLKKFITGKGNAPKSKMEKEIFKRWKVELDTEHEVDAYALAKMGYFIMVKQNHVYSYQEEAMKVVVDDESKQNYFKGRINND